MQQTNTLGLLVRQKRRRDQTTLKQASAQCGVSGTTLSNIERGKHVQDITTLVKLSRWLGIPTHRAINRGYIEGASTLEIIQAAIYSDANLTNEDACKLSRLIETTYNLVIDNHENHIQM